MRGEEGFGNRVGASGPTLASLWRTLSACRVETFLDACLPSRRTVLSHRGTRPRIVPRAVHEPRFNRVVLNVGDYSAALSFVAYPMVVGFLLPKRLSGSTEQLVGLPGGVTLKGLQKASRTDVGNDQQVDMVGHDDIGFQIVVAQFFCSATDSSYDEFGYVLLLKVERTGSGRVQVPVHPREGASGVLLVRGRVESVWQASVQMPSEEQWPAVPIVMGEPTAMRGHLCLSLDPSERGWQASRKSRRGTLGVCATKARVQTCAFCPLANRLGEPQGYPMPLRG